MDVLDWILVAIRWLHALAAVAWVGGSIFYLMVLGPASRRSVALESQTRDRIGEAVAVEFKGLVNTAIAVLLISGVVLALSRLTHDAVSLPYVAVLAAKVALALYMFYTVRFLERRPRSQAETGAQGDWARWRSRLTGRPAVLATGVVVFGLSDVLDALFERGLM